MRMTVGSVPHDLFDLVPSPLAIASGHYRSINGAVWTAENKFGRNSEVTTGTDPEDVWDAGGLWVAPTTARLHDIASTDTTDDAAGTGARTVQVYGLDANYVLQNEIVSMDGVSNVATASTYTRIFRMVVRSAGGGAANAGDISATAQTDGTVTAQINVGNNQTLMAVYTIPAATTGYILQWNGTINKSGGNAGAVDLTLRVRPFGEVWQVKWYHGLMTTGSSHFDSEYRTPLEIAPRSDILVRIDGVTATVDIGSSFDIAMVAAV